MLIAVYGTLRKGDRLHRGYLKSPPLLATERVSGFEMYHYSGYPYVAEGDGDITVEVYDIPKDVYMGVYGMERSAGYEVATINTSVGEADLFYVTAQAHEREQGRLNYKGEADAPPRILSGDWFEWLRKFRPGRIEDGSN